MSKDAMPASDDPQDHSLEPYRNPVEDILHVLPVVANGVPAYKKSITDPVEQKLEWTPDGPESFATRPGSSAFGLGAVIGTLPDMGFAFSAKASVLITVPDVRVRAGLNARALAPRVSIATKQEEAGFGYSAKGMLSIDGDAVDFAVIGKAELPPLLKVVVPVAGHFDRNDSSQWYIYLGADGAPTQGRQIGPGDALPEGSDPTPQVVGRVHHRHFIGWSL